MTDDDRAAIVAATKTLATMTDVVSGATQQVDAMRDKVAAMRDKVAAITERMKAKKPRKPRGPGRFTQSEVTRFFKGAKKADPNATVKMNTDCSMVIVPGKPEPTNDGPSTENEWDQVK
jgi:hypothetical protein